MKTMDDYNEKSLRPNDMSQKEYAKYLRIPERTVENWEYRNTSNTTWKLLFKILTLQEENDKLKEIIKDNNMTFILPSEKGH